MEGPDLTLSFTQTEIDKIIEEAENNLEIQQLRSPDHWLPDLLDEEHVFSIPLPWEKTHGRFELRSRELTLWAGESGVGKSLFLGQVMAHLITQGQGVVIASMEMRPVQTLKRILGQCAGVNYGRVSKDFKRRWVEWAKGRLWIYDQLDTVEATRVLRMIKAAAYSLDVQHIVIDSLVKCGLPQSGGDYLTKQTKFCDQLQHLAKHMGIHIHLVTHLRKPDTRQTGGVTKHDIRGASQIADLADNIVLLSRNRLKEKSSRKHPEELSALEEQALEQPDMFFEVPKQRDFPDEPTFGFDFLPECGQFVSPGRKKPMTWPRGSEILPWAIPIGKPDRLFEDFDE